MVDVRVCVVVNGEEGCRTSGVGKCGREGVGGKVMIVGVERVEDYREDWRV